MTTALAQLYHPLDPHHETRVLAIEPGAFAAPLVCALEHIPWRSGRGAPYRALSYCWGAALGSAPSDLRKSEGGEERDGGENDEDDDDGEENDEARREWAGSLYSSLGFPLPEARILCGGVEVTVQGELHAALKRLRSHWMAGREVMQQEQEEEKEQDPALPQYREDKLRIWVDALCIQQTNADERTRHVAVMGEIYRRAECVHVWLGEATGDVGKALDDLGRCRALEMRLGASGVPVVNMDVLLRFYHRADWRALRHLFERTWFYRVWCIQELAFSRHALVHVGERHLPWKELFDSMENLKVFHRVGIMIEKTGPNNIALMEEMRLRVAAKEAHEPCKYQSPMHLQLLRTLEKGRNFKSTWACDKIYALLGLQPSNEITIDYTLDHPAIFTNFAIRYLQAYEDLHLLYHCSATDKPILQDGPSFVPDWTQLIAAEPLYILGLPTNAAGSTSPSFKLDTNAMQLRVQGIVVDTIAHVGRVNMTGSQPSRAGSSTTTGRALQDEAQAAGRAIVADWKVRIADCIAVAFPARECTPAQWEAFWRALMCNRLKTGDVPGPAYQQVTQDALAARLCGTTLEAQVTHRRRQGLEAEFAARWGLARDEGTATDLRLANEVVLAWNQWTPGRRFFRTVGGRLGWCPLEARAGDVLVVLLGARYPFVLREGGEGFRLVGHCYLHGVMEGEVFEGEPAVEELVIC